MVDAPQVPVIKGVQPEAKEAPQVPQQSSLDHRSSPNPTSPLKPTPPTKPKKRLKLILIILIALVGLSIGGFFVWKYFFASKTSVPLLERIVKQKKEEEVYIYKGVWLPALVFREPNFLASNIQKLKGMGINTIFIEASPPQSERWLEKVKEFFPPELVERIAEILPSEKELIIDNIQIAHRNGLKVGLTISDLGLTISDPPEMGEVDLEVLNSEIVEYAKLAEEYEVELFAPMNEPGKVFGENTGKWRQEILPKIKKVYNGEVIWKGAGIGLPEKELTEEFLKELSEGPPGDLSGYDYRGFSSMFIPRESLEPEEPMVVEVIEEIDETQEEIAAEEPISDVAETATVFEPEPVIMEVMENLAKNISMKIKLVSLLQEGEVKTETFDRLFNTYVARGELLMNSRNETLERVRYDLDSRERALNDAKIGLDELMIRKAIGDVSEEEYQAKSPGFEWDIGHYKDDFTRKKAEIAYLDDLTQVMSNEEIAELREQGEAGYGALDDLSGSELTSPDTAARIKVTLEEALTCLNASCK